MSCVDVGMGVCCVRMCIWMYVYMLCVVVSV